MTTPAQTLYYRNVHPDWIKAGHVTSQAFRPTPKDYNRLSVDDERLSTPEESFRRGNRRPRISVGIMAISQQDCTDLGLAVTPDPTDDNPAHTLIAFPNIPKQEQRKIGQALRNRSEKRGWLYQPNSC